VLGRFGVAGEGGHGYENGEFLHNEEYRVQGTGYRVVHGRGAGSGQFHFSTPYSVRSLAVHLRRGAAISGLL
jgi:hypothetical protein